MFSNNPINSPGYGVSSRIPGVMLKKLGRISITDKQSRENPMQSNMIQDYKDEEEQIHDRKRICT